MKRICIMGNIDDGILKVGESSAVFKYMRKVLNQSLGIPTHTLGEEDINLEGEQLSTLKGSLQTFIEDEISSFHEDDEKTRTVQFLGRSLQLNMRNDHHRFLASLIMIFKMVHNQLKHGRTFHLFNLTPLDNTTNYVLMTIKAFDNAETKNFFYTLFISKYAEFDDMAYTTFERLINKLSAAGFLRVDDSGQTVAVTDKTSMIPL